MAHTPLTVVRAPVVAVAAAVAAGRAATAQPARPYMAQAAEVPLKAVVCSTTFGTPTTARLAAWGSMAPAVVVVAAAAAAMTAPMRMAQAVAVGALADAEPLEQEPEGLEPAAASVWWRLRAACRCTARRSIKDKVAQAEPVA